MSVSLKMGDRRPMKVWSWLGAFRDELLLINPAYVAARLTPDMLDRVIDLAPKAAQWLLDVAEAARDLKR